MKLNQLKYVVLSLIFLINCIPIYCVYAYLTDHGYIQNRFTYGSVKTEITETFQIPDNLKPGMEISKNVTIKNTGTSDCYIKVRVVFTDSDMEKYCEIDFNTRDFSYNSKDEFYYYNKILQAGEETECLMTKVQIDNSIPEEEIKNFDIIVYQESYQTGGREDGKWREFETYEDAWETYAENKPEA